MFAMSYHSVKNNWQRHCMKIEGQSSLQSKTKIILAWIESVNIEGNKSVCKVRKMFAGQLGLSPGNIQEVLSSAAQLQVRNKQIWCKKEMGH